MEEQQYQLLGRQPGWERYADWIVVDRYLSDSVERRIQAELLEEDAEHYKVSASTKEACRVITLQPPGCRFREFVLVLNPELDPEWLACTVETIENEGSICPITVAEILGDNLSQLWDEADTPRRLEWVLKARVPVEQVLKEDVPEQVWEVINDNPP